MLVAVATALLPRSGESWRSLGLRQPGSYGPTLAWGVGAAVVIVLLLPPLLRPIAEALGRPPRHTGQLGDLCDPWRFFLFLAPIGWGITALHFGLTDS